MSAELFTPGLSPAIYRIVAGHEMLLVQGGQSWCGAIALEDSPRQAEGNFQ